MTIQGRRGALIVLLAVIAVAGGAGLAALTGGSTPPIASPSSPVALVTFSPAPTPSPSPTKAPKPTPTPKPTPRPKPWTTAYRLAACNAINKLYDITPVVDRLTADTGTPSFQNGDYAVARDDASEIVTLANQAEAIVGGLPAWAPGATLESDITSAATNLGSGAATFVTGVDESNVDTMRQGALQMSTGGPEVAVAQNEYDSLASRYGGSCP